MFTLRRITNDGLEINTFIGIEYNLILRESNPEAFKETVKLWSEEDVEDVYGCVVFNEGKDIMPLYLHEKSKYYIMTSDGNTFANISKR